MEVLSPGCAVKVIAFLLITTIFYCSVAATNHSVGGDSGWDLSSDLQAWSAATTFRVGDYLVFKYLPLHDVLEVNRTDFSNCGTVNPIRTHRDGETVIHLGQQGTRYFICGRLQFRHCKMGLKVRIQVLQQNSTDQEQRRRPRPPSQPHPPVPDIPEAPSPCNCSGVGKVMGKGPMKWSSVMLLLL